MSAVMLHCSKPAAQNFQEQSILFLPKKAGCTLFGCWKDCIIIVYKEFYLYSARSWWDTNSCHQTPSTLYYCHYKFFFYYHCTYPGDWRIAEVWPVLKEGDFEQPSNNRPISLLPILSKVCEKVVLHQPTPYLKTNKRLMVEQSREKKLHSTETSLIVYYRHYTRGSRQEEANRCYLCGYEQSVW